MSYNLNLVSDGGKMFTNKMADWSFWELERTTPQRKIEKSSESSINLYKYIHIIGYLPVAKLIK